MVEAAMGQGCWGWRRSFFVSSRCQAKEAVLTEAGLQVGPEQLPVLQVQQARHWAKTWGAQTETHRSRRRLLQRAAAELHALQRARQG